MCPGNPPSLLNHRVYEFNDIAKLDILIQHLESARALGGRGASLLWRHVGLKVVLV